MPEAVLIFTFSPVQPFIMEARRAADLFTGSRILVELAKAAVMVVQGRGGTLIFPAKLGDDVPNKLVATVPAERVRDIAEAAREALLQKWVAIARSARGGLDKYSAPGDATWEAIWERQISSLWEIYWAGAPMTGGPQTYADAYRQADAALNAAKRTRAFDSAEEHDLKDTLSGRREALHTAGSNAKAYWTQLSRAPGMIAAKLRPEGRERLDALGAIKRFSDIAEKQPFFSTSTVASEDFRTQAEGHLGPYRNAVEALIPQGKLYRVRPDGEWPYDGDLFYLETLTPERLRDSYGVDQVDQARLRNAQNELRELYRLGGRQPSPYYAVIVLDGDNMGKRIAECLKDRERAQRAHQKLSERLAHFADCVEGIVEQHASSLIYNGGDDVLLLAPLSQALPVAQELVQRFRTITEGTASAGIAIAHHLYPLDAALANARRAEEDAKNRYGRNALCIRALKRSGETLEVGTQWSTGRGEDLVDVAGLLKQLIEHFAQERLSSRFAYEVADQARIVTALSAQARSATLKRLVGRHKTNRLSDAEAEDLQKRLNAWMAALDDWAPTERQDGREIPQGFAELGRWLVLARFIAQGGGE